MNMLIAALGILFILLAIAIAIYLITARRYQSSSTVASSYDQWTEDGILEFYWGEHIHLGGVSGFIKSLREVPTILLMRLAFGTGLCRFGIFRAIRSNSQIPSRKIDAAKVIQI